MEPASILLFAVIVFVASYVQAVAGFAMGMILVAVAGGLRLMDVPTLTAVISLMTMLNVYIALRGLTHQIHRHLFKWLALGQVPAIFIGFQFMHFLDGNTLWALELALGVFILVGGLSMFLKPHPWPAVTGKFPTWCVGLTGGMVGGMFSASGPVLGWFGYNQPLSVAVIRATLLACFALTTGTRTIIVGFTGGLTESVWVYAAAGLPIVVLGTWLGRNLPPPVTEERIKQFAYWLLIVMGAWILGSVALESLAHQPS